MIINDKYLFIHIQRSGGSFVEKFLLENFDGWVSIIPKHGGISEVYEQLIEISKETGYDLNNILRFGVVRNPWNWYVSWWSANSKNILSGKGTNFPKIFFEETAKDFNVFMKHIMTTNFGRENYINSAIMQRENIGAYTYRYMICHYASDNNNSIVPVVDAIIHQENLREELASLLKLSPERRKILFDMENYHVGSYKPFREYYNEESIDLVAKKDKFIIDTHNYSFY